MSGARGRSAMRAAAWIPAVLCLVWLSGCGERSVAPPAPEAGALLAADERIAALLRPCERDEFYERDLSDMVPILIDKLERGQPEPIQRAVEELGLLGETSLEALERALARTLADRGAIGLANQVVAALAANRAEGADELLFQALAHPHENVRQAVFRALGRERGRPEHFDLLLPRVWMERGTTARMALRALAESDPERFEAQALEWARARELMGLADDVLMALARARSEAMLDALEQSIEELPAGSQPYAAAALEAGGREVGREFLGRALASPAREDRAAALVAAGHAGLVEVLLVTLRGDPDPGLRAEAARFLGAAESLDSRARAGLRAATQDPQPVLRATAREALARHGDEEVLDGMLAEWMDARWEDLARLLITLRPLMREDRELAERALFHARRRYELERHLPLAGRAQSLQALAQVPLEEAAKRLLEAGREAAGEQVEGLDGHRWTAILAGNTGREGRAFVARELERERDPIRRLDLLWAVAAERDDLAGEVLAARVADASAEPLERLYAASLWVRQGPSWDVAPVLRRLALEFEGEERRALNCLLWHWY